jgi:purine-nucleoside phosphorylase
MPTELDTTISFLKKELPYAPEIGIILGSGLGSLANEISINHEISYSDIPGFPQTTVKGHDGKLLLGDFGGKKVLAFRGRFHYYEGYSMDQVVIPVRVMALLGAKRMIVSNACGGVNPDFAIGDLMLIKDHINLFPDNPLMGKNKDEWGTRFPDMSKAYSAEMIEKAEKAAKELDVKVQKGVYAGLTGPCLETPAEYKYVRIIGADAVGMSTVPEVIAANHMGIKSFGVSVITDLGVEGKIVETTHEDVVRAAEESSGRLVKLTRKLIEEL